MQRNNWTSNSSGELLFHAIVGREKRSYDLFQFWCTDVTLKAVCLTGIVGNALNLTAFIRQRFGRGSQEGLEHSVSRSLMALAVSDLCICASGMLIGETIFGSRPPQLLAVYGKIYAAGIVNTLLAVSVWLTLSITVCRYLVVWQPLRSRRWLTHRKIRAVIAGIFAAAFLLHIPEFFKYSMQYTGNCTATAAAPAAPGKQGGINASTCYQTRRHPEMNPGLSSWIGLAYQWFTCALVNICPLIGIAICNIKLALIYRTGLRQRNTLTLSSERHAASRRAVDVTTAFAASPSYQSTDKLTPLLATVTTIFFATIAPAQVVNFCCRMLINDSLMPRLRLQDAGAVRGYFNANRVLQLTTLSQVAGCAMNFVFYCMVSSTFRKTMVRALCSCTGRGAAIHHRLQMAKAGEGGGGAGGCGTVRVRGQSCHGALPNGGTVMTLTMNDKDGDSDEEDDIRDHLEGARMLLQPQLLEDSHLFETVQLESIVQDDGH